MDLFDLVGKLTLDANKFTQGVKSAESAGNNLAEKMSGMFNKLENAAKVFVTGAGITKAVSIMKGLISDAHETGERIDKQSQVLGISRKAYQEWDYILSQNGASIDNLGISMKTLNGLILSGVDGSTEAKDAFAELGLSVHELDNMSQEEQFETVVKAFQRMPAGAQKSALAVKIFGKQGMALLPLLNSTSESVDELKQKAEDLGLIMGDDAVDAAAAYDDSLDTMQRTFKALRIAIGSQFLPVLTNAFEKIAGFAGKLIKAYNKDGFKGVWDTIVDTVKNIPWPTWDDVKNAFIKAWNTIKAGAKSIMVLIFGEDENGGIKWPTAGEIIGKIKQGLTDMWNAVQGVFDEVGKLIFGEDENGGVKWPTAYELGEKVRSILSTIWGGVQSVFSEIAKLIFGDTEDGGIQFPATAEEWWEKIKGTVTNLWKGVAESAKDVINFVLGALGLPDIDETVAKIKAWWEDVKKRIKLEIQVHLFGFNPDEQSWADSVRDTNKRFGINTPTLTEEDMARYADDNFATGTPSIPYDNFLASLHRGEMVLTASQARDYRDGGSKFDFSGLKAEIIAAVRTGLANATVRAYIDGQDVTDRVNRNNNQQLRARRFAT